METENKIKPTSVRIPPALKKRLKVAVAQNDTDSTAVIIAGIEDWLEKHEKAGEHPKLQVKANRR